MDDVTKVRIEALMAVTSGDRWATVEAGSIYQKLRASDCLLIEAYNHSVGQGGGTPSGELQCDSSGGSPELCPVLYWLNNPPSGDMGKTVEAIVCALEIWEGAPLPASRITPALYAEIVAQAKGSGIIGPDGSIYGESKYEGLDDGWLVAFVHFLYYQAEHHKVHNFGTSPQKFTLSGSGGDDAVTIAIVGDWGTGRYGDDGGPGLAVLADIRSLNPDYVVHLGDVYYAGTAGYDHILSEEWRNFVSLWPAEWGNGTGRSFALNSNHEQYDGANGYFGVALGKDAPFAHQKSTSYFALCYGDWVVLCLDSAYYADASHFFMDGSIDGSSGAQAKWIRSNVDLKGKKVIVLTHHNAIDYTGETPVEPFWTNVRDAVSDATGGDLPAYWYWGHIHNGIVYSDKSAAGPEVKIRCVGHGAIPFGKAWGLEGAGCVDYFAHTAIPNSLRVRNGFATIRLTTDGGITERFYETTATPGKPIQVWPTPS